jgi:DNA polymerase III subunit alpha, Gram-positive type
MSEKYKIIPNKSEFTSFLETLNTSPGELEAVQNIVLVDVDVDSAQGTWTINYQKKTRDLRTELLAAVAEKLTAACSLQGVAFLPCQEADKGQSEEKRYSEEYLEALKFVNGQSNTPAGDRKILGNKIGKKPRPMCDVTDEENNIVVEGTIVGFKERELRTGAVMLSILVKDNTDGLVAKKRFGEGKNKEELVKNLAECRAFMAKIPEGSNVCLMGNVRVDKFENDEVVMTDIRSIMLMEKEERMDNSAVKRVELHCHTKMSKLDAVTPIKELVKTAMRWGHKALAITDHGVVQAFPFAYDEVAGKDFKLIFGVEGYLWPDEHVKKTYHIIILAKTAEGLRNLYRLISMSHLQFFGGKPARPRMTRDLIEQYREGLIIGSACAAGEVFQAIINGATQDEILEIAKFYDYMEIQPTGNNQYLIREDKYPNINTQKDLENINKRIYDIGKELGKLTVATCDVHFLNPEDAAIRTILQAGQGYRDAEEQPPLFLRTTEEMLAEFSYLGQEKAYEIVVINPNIITEQIDSFKPVPDRDQLYSPIIPGAEKKIKDMTYEKAHELYGDKLPTIVEERLKLELNSIIGNGFAVLYYIAHLLVKKSNDDGYMVGSRGSVGSSLVATMLNITEVNPLKPHYCCPKCKYSEFFEDGSVSSGFDLPVKRCPECGYEMVRDGHDIPFAVFMGFHGEKVPDIDLNFSGDYQPQAHKYTEELFGRDNVFRAGTLGTIAAKTAYGYVKKYFDGKGRHVRNAFVEGMIPGLVDVKRTTGQHPGGIMVLPRNLDIHYITPVQYPADDASSGIITTHFDYHSINDRLVKLDILGHDDPTVIKMLETLLHKDIKTIPIGDPETMSLFQNTKALGVTPEEIGSEVGTFGIPECGTQFVRQMIYDVQPKNFSDLLRISGYSHGTDVWLNNAQELIKEGKPTEETISTRDDIMTSLINKGVEPSIAFSIMETCRKGKAHKNGLSDEQMAALEKAHVPDWYVKSCKTVQYLFPKAHAVAYVISAYRIAYCKVHHPKEFYAAYFSIRAPKFDYALVHKGKDFMKRYIKDVYAQNKKAKVNEKDTATYMELVIEMFARGFEFENIDLYRSDAHRFMVTDKGLLPPLGALAGIGDVAADGIAKARENGPFISREDLRTRAKIGNAVIEAFADLGIIDELPATDQIELF